MLSHIRIKYDPSDRANGEISVDGHNLIGATRSLHLEVEGEDYIPVVAVELVSYLIEADVEGQAVVFVPPRVEDELVRLGWKRPEAQA